MKLSTSLIFTLVISLFIYLGIWQLNRAQYKRYLSNKITNQANIAAVPINHLIKQDYAQYRFTRVQIIGNAINNKNILLDNQSQNKRAGYKILTPISLIDQPNMIVLLDRGFIPSGKSRQELPLIPPLNNPITVIGIINNPTTGILLKAEHYTDNIKWPLLVQSVDVPQLKKIFGENLCDFVVQINTSIKANDKYTQEIHKHTSYAYQWFTFAILGLCYYLYHLYK